MKNILCIQVIQTFYQMDVKVSNPQILRYQLEILKQKPNGDTSKLKDILVDAALEAILFASLSRGWLSSKNMVLLSGKASILMSLKVGYSSQLICTSPCSSFYQILLLSEHITSRTFHSFILMNASRQIKICM